MEGGGSGGRGGEIGRDTGGQGGTRAIALPGMCHQLERRKPFLWITITPDGDPEQEKEGAKGTLLSRLGGRSIPSRW